MRFELSDGKIQAVSAETSNGDRIKISGNKKPLIVVNAAGPWIQDVVASLGINLNIELRLGVQMAVPGHYFQSGIITFDKNGAYCICLPRDGYVQVGPTNTVFTGQPDSIDMCSEDLNQLLRVFKSLIKLDATVEGHGFLKAGFANLYTLFPGKMSLGLLAADEMLWILAKDGWYRSERFNLTLRCALDGNRGYLICLKKTIISIILFYNRGYRISVIHQFSKLIRRVRLPLPAPPRRQPPQSVLIPRDACRKSV